jgi:hypothetical protein
VRWRVVASMSADKTILVPEMSFYITSVILSNMTGLTLQIEVFCRVKPATSMSTSNCCMDCRVLLSVITTFQLGLKTQTRMTVRPV